MRHIIAIARKKNADGSVSCYYFLNDRIHEPKLDLKPIVLRPSAGASGFGEYAP